MAVEQETARETVADWLAPLGLRVATGLKVDCKAGQGETCRSFLAWMAFRRVCPWAIKRAFAVET